MKYDTFVEKVTKDTRDHKIAWISHLEFQESLSDDLFIAPLFFNEFHELIGDCAFVGFHNHFIFILVHERFESGKDGTVQQMKNLYFTPNLQMEFSYVHLSDEQFQHLLSEIKNGEVSNLPQSLIESYLAT